MCFVEFFGSLQIFTVFNISVPVWAVFEMEGLLPSNILTTS